MKKLATVTVLVLCWAQLSWSQTSAFDSKHWDTLSEVSYSIEQDNFGSIYVPKFTPEIKALEGKYITLPGFIVNLEGMFKPEHIILSSLPIAACFFCGNAGPESVIEVFLKQPIKLYKEPVKIRGKLRLNSDNYQELMYILEDAELVEVMD